MKSVSIICIKNQARVADQCDVAECFLDRLRGLMGRKKLAERQGLLIRPCNSIHTWFMKFPIDVVFLQVKRGASSGIITQAYENVLPWKLIPLMEWHATDTLELPVGTIRRCALSTGDELWLS